LRCHSGIAHEVPERAIELGAPIPENTDDDTANNTDDDKTKE